MRRLLLEVLVVTLVVIAAAAMVSGVLNALASTADARVKAGPNVSSAHHRLKAPAGVFDGGLVSQPAATSYSFRLLRAAYTGPAMKIRRATSGTLDIGFAGGSFDTAAAAAFCNATTCVADTVYDQSGNGRHVTNPNGTPYNPDLVFNCIGALPCLRGGTQTLDGPSVTPAGAQSISVVGRVDTVAASCAFLKPSGQQVGANNGTANNWLIFASGALFAPAVQAAWHAGQGVVNGAGTVLGVDGADTTGNLTTVVTAGAVSIGGLNDAGKLCSWTEGVWWNGYALTAGERAALTANQRAYWGF